RVEIVAQRRAYASHFVGGDLFALAAAAEHDAAIGNATSDRAANRKANRRIVDRRFTVGAVIVHRVAKPRQGLLEVFLQDEARMVGANRDSHGEGLYYVALAMIPIVVISARGEARLRSGHPWIYRT